MIYFALTVLALRTFGHVMNAMGVKLEEKIEKKEPPQYVKFVIHSIFITAYVYILLQFISIK